MDKSGSGAPQRSLWGQQNWQSGNGDNRQNETSRDTASDSSQDARLDPGQNFRYHAEVYQPATLTAAPSVPTSMAREPSVPNPSPSTILPGGSEEDRQARMNNFLQYATRHAGFSLESPLATHQPVNTRGPYGNNVPAATFGAIPAPPSVPDGTATSNNIFRPFSEAAPRASSRHARPRSIGGDNLGGLPGSSTLPRPPMTARWNPPQTPRPADRSARSGFRQRSGLHDPPSLSQTSSNVRELVPSLGGTGNQNSSRHRALPPSSTMASMPVNMNSHPQTPPNAERGPPVVSRVLIDTISDVMHEPTGFVSHSLISTESIQAVEERSCDICYNDFGVASPEGNVEMPRRILGCNHVFGHLCLEKWLMSAYTCPMCRTYLPEAHDSADYLRLWRNYLQHRGALPHGMDSGAEHHDLRMFLIQTSNSFFRRLLSPRFGFRGASTRRRSRSSNTTAPPQGRRRMADDEDTQRRTRARFHPPAEDNSPTSTAPQGPVHNYHSRFHEASRNAPPPQSQPGDRGSGQTPNGQASSRFITYANGSRHYQASPSSYADSSTPARAATTHTSGAAPVVVRTFGNYYQNPLMVASDPIRHEFQLAAPAGDRRPTSGFLPSLGAQFANSGRTGQHAVFVDGGVLEDDAASVGSVASHETPSSPPGPSGYDRNGQFLAG